MAERFQARGLRVVGVTSTPRLSDVTEREAINDTIREERMTWSCYLDERGAWAREQSVRQVPSFLVIGRDGRAFHRGYGTLQEGAAVHNELVAAIERALAE